MGKPSTGDSMASHNGKSFSTKDRDNDTNKDVNCAAHFKGPWWYHNCHGVNINGLYLGNKGDDTGMRWYKVKARTSKNN